MSRKIVVRSWRDRIREVAELRDDGVTKQSHKDECDINKIMARYQRTGVIDHVQKYGPVYADVSSADYVSSMNLVKDAETMFAELPSTVRAKFGNDVVEFLDVVTDPERIGELEELGVAPSRKPSKEPDGAEDAQNQPDPELAGPAEGAQDGAEEREAAS